MSQVLRQHAEQQFAEELDALQKADSRHRPTNSLLKNPQNQMNKNIRYDLQFSLPIL